MIESVNNRLPLTTGIGSVGERKGFSAFLLKKGPVYAAIVYLSRIGKSVYTQMVHKPCQNSTENVIIGRSCQSEILIFPSAVLSGTVKSIVISNVLQHIKEKN